MSAGLTCEVCFYSTFLNLGSLSSQVYNVGAAVRSSTDSKGNLAARVLWALRLLCSPHSTPFVIKLTGQATMMILWHYGHVTKARVHSHDGAYDWRSAATCTPASHCCETMRCWCWVGAASLAETDAVAVVLTPSCAVAAAIVRLFEPLHCFLVGLTHCIAIYARHCLINW